MSTRRSRALLWTLGGVVTVGSIAVGVEVLRRLEDRIVDMVRTPAGCESVVEFTGTGEFFVYVETDGVVGDLGACGNDERVYSFDGRPDVDVTIQSSDGTVVDLTSDQSAEYDTGTFAGESVATFEVADRGSYVITVDGDRDAVVAVGRDVSPEGQIAFIMVAFAMLAGLVLLVIALVQSIGARRRSRRVPVVLNYADGTTTWAPPSPEDGAVRGDAGP